MLALIKSCSNRIKSNRIVSQFHKSGKFELSPFEMKIMMRLLGRKLHRPTGEQMKEEILAGLYIEEPTTSED